MSAILWCLCGCKEIDHGPDEPFPCLVCGCPAFRQGIGPREYHLMVLEFLETHSATGTRDGDWFRFQLGHLPE